LLTNSFLLLESLSLFSLSEILISIEYPFVNLNYCKRMKVLDCSKSTIKNELRLIKVFILIGLFLFIEVKKTVA